MKRGKGEENVTTRIQLKVIPGASVSEISGWIGDALKVRVSSQPERGKANRAVITLISSVLGIRAGAVRIVAGRYSQKKVIEIEGLSLSDIRGKLAKKHVLAAQQD